MKKLTRTQKQFKSDLKAAGLTFIGTYMADILRRKSVLDDTSVKAELAEEYYEHQITTSDTKVESTQSKLNAVLRIIKSEKVLEALDAVIISKKTIVDPRAKAKAKKCKQDILSGIISLPKLEEF